MSGHRRIINWVYDGSISGLMLAMHKYPERFAHLGREYIHKSPNDWRCIAEGLCQSLNTDTLPTTTWLNKNGFSGLVNCIKANPELFSDIKHDSGFKKKEDWVKLAEEIALNNNGLLPTDADTRKANPGLFGAISRYPKAFVHIPTTRKSQTDDELAKKAEELASNNNGVLPNPYWLEQNGYTSLANRIRKRPERFVHIVKGSKKGKKLSDHIKKAEELADVNGGVLPSISELEKEGHLDLVSAICHNKSRFAHVKQQRLRAPSKTPNQWADELRNLIREKGGRPGCYWMKKNGYGTLYRLTVQHPDWFEGI